MRLRPPAIAVFLAIAATACARGPVNTDAQLYAMVDTIGLAELRRSPERAAVLGVAVQTFGEDYRSRLDDRSMAAVERMRATRLDFLRQLEAVDRATLSRDASRTLEIAQRVVSSTVKMDAYSFGYADLGRASPYLISQMDGAYAGVIDFMTVDQTIGSRADADAWLARLEHVDDAVTDEYRRFEIDRERGVLPPAGILQQALEKARALQSADPLAHPLTQFFAESLSQLNDLPEGEIASLIGKAAGIVEDDIGPVYDRLVTLLETSAASAAPEPGVWRIPNGEAYYEDALRLYTTSDLTPRQIRDVGVALVEELTGEINTALIALGRTEGTVGQRLEAMRLEPLFLYPDTLEGRAALLAAVSERASWGEQKAPAMLSVAAAAQVEIKLAPASLETAGPDIHYRPAALDGSRQAALILNLRSTLDWPNWTLPTLAYREAAPGRHLQLGIARARAAAPLLDHLTANPAFSEGWATYAEDLAKELGAYEKDPAGRLGYLQSLLFRAAHMVADTGIHHDRWTRDRAVAYLVTVTGLPLAAMQSEIDRSIVWPGFACAAMIGREKIRNLREDADIELGPDFDLKSFHDAVLAGGARPLGALESDIRDWIASRRPAPPALPQS